LKESHGIKTCVDLVLVILITSTTSGVTISLVDFGFGLLHSGVGIRVCDAMSPDGVIVANKTLSLSIQGDNTKNNFA
jgi:hypothetical protein